jgi:hypothetical protein
MVANMFGVMVRLKLSQEGLLLYIPNTPLRGLSTTVRIPIHQKSSHHSELRKLLYALFVTDKMPAGNHLSGCLTN